MRKISCSLIFLLLVSVGCTPIISKELRKKVAEEISFKQITKEPDAYKGKLILLSGVILCSKNTKKGTLLVLSAMVLLPILVPMVKFNGN